MAAALLKTSGMRASFLRLPPDVRSSVFRTQSRTFASTLPRKLSMVDLAIGLPNACLDGIHAFGIPWYATIPLTAALARSLVYFGVDLPRRKQQQTRALLAPLTAARLNAAVQDPQMSSFNKKWIRDTPLPNWLKFKLWIWWLQRRTVIDTDKAFGYPEWRQWMGLVNISVLITFTEALRLKSGRSEGLLSVLLSPLQWLAHKIAPDGFSMPSTAPKRNTEEGLAARLETHWEEQQQTAQAAQAEAANTTSRASDLLNGGVTDGGRIGADAVSQTGPFTTHLPPVSDAQAVSPYFDPSLHHEGIAWFTDLTLPDSTVIFPTLLFGTLVATRLLKPQLQPGGRPATKANLTADQFRRSEVAPSPTASANTTPPVSFLLATQSYLEKLPISDRAGLYFAVVISSICAQVPVAIVLYFISSTVIGWTQQRWLDLKYPLTQPITACSRKMRMKVNRKWGFKTPK